MTLLEQMAEAFVEAVLPGFKRARKRVRNPPAPNTPPRPPDAPVPPFDPDAAMLRFIWDLSPEQRQNFGGSFPRFQQAYAHGWIRWQYDGTTLHLWVGPPGNPDFSDTPPPRPMPDCAIPDALKALGLKPSPQPPPEAIRRAFRSLAPTCHPDRFPGDTRKLTRYKKLTAAYAVLKGAKLA